ncbi:hypothetical protein FN846DRAFT_902079 [Sphaerosporella brunnea]|uniref:Uncharacterized protein n=1 Tax=Sphaerosporella brunnea TaxID=1250544 RepID=A0A5J5FAZ4_9PEZI|nr:hypothetical protein FN846DRAFT_902079 [Sphaerosporella brunnea]
MRPASLFNTKAKWLASWPAADASAPQEDDVTIVLPKAMRRAPAVAAALENEDIDLAAVHTAPDDKGLADLLDAPPTHDAATQSVDPPFPQLLPAAAVGVTRGEVQGMMQQILAAVNRTQHQPPGPEPSQQSRGGRRYHAEGRAQVATAFANHQSLAACQETRRTVCAHRDDLLRDPIKYREDCAWKTERVGILPDRDTMEARGEAQHAKIEALEEQIGGLQKKNRAREAEHKRREAEANRRKWKGGPRGAATGGASKCPQCGA